MRNFKAGTFAVDITPVDSQFLNGYPHVERYSEGVYDRLWSSALYLADEDTQLIFVANDIVYIPKIVTTSARNRISELTGVPASNIMITATHTHSGPMTKKMCCCEYDKVIPAVDEVYVKFLEDGIVQAAVRAVESKTSAKIGLALADSSCVGGNRRDPSGPSDPQVPVLAVKDIQSDAYMAVMVVCSVHPTVLHEDSKLVSGDFPGLCRQFLQNNVVGRDCVILHHSGPCGNQSPRHIARENTFEEAERLGVALGKNIGKALGGIKYSGNVKLVCRRMFVEFPRQTFSDVVSAEKKLDATIERLQKLRETNASHAEIRTAECDWFGAEEQLCLSKASADGRLDNVIADCMPVEIQLFCIGQWKFVGWQGEMFVEYALAVKSQSLDTFVISLANGEFEGYIVTAQAAEEGGYEASLSLFTPESGNILVEKSLDLINNQE